MPGARKSAQYIFLGNLFSKLITFIGSIVLARILFPEDYGYLLMAMIVTGFAQTLANMGFENYYLQEIIKDKEHEKNILNVTFKMRIALNTTMFFIQFFGSYFVADYYQQAVVGELLRLFSFNYLITGFSVINLFILRKKLNYKPETIANVSRDITGTIVKIILAMMGFGVLSFAYGALVGNLVRSMIIFFSQRFSFELNVWDSDEFKKILFFGKHSLLGGIGNYFSTYIDKVLITKYFSASESGYYYFANAQSSTLYNYTVYPQSSLFLSYIAKYKTNPKRLFNVLSKLSYMIGILSLPLMLFLLFYAEPIFQLVFGEKWNGSIVLFQIFLVYNYLKVLVFPLTGVLTGFGYPQIVSKLSIIRLVVLGLSLTMLLQITSNIYFYALMYVLIVLLFDWMKGALGLKIMHYTLLTYLYKMQFISIFLIALLQITILFILNGLMAHENIFFQMLFSVFILSVSTIFIAYFLQKQQLLSSLELFVSSNHKIMRILKKYE